MFVGYSEFWVQIQGYPHATWREKETIQFQPRPPSSIYKNAYFSYFC